MVDSSRKAYLPLELRTRCTPSSVVLTKTDGSAFLHELPHPLVHRDLTRLVQNKCETYADDLCNSRGCYLRALSKFSLSKKKFKGVVAGFTAQRYICPTSYTSSALRSRQNDSFCFTESLVKNKTSSHSRSLDPHHMFIIYANQGLPE